MFGKTQKALKVDNNMETIRLTTAQALVRFLSNQLINIEGEVVPVFAGVFAIFGHGNVAGIGEALHQERDNITTYRAHNEQSMAHSAIAFAKANNRQRMMACTTSIGPGATNMVTAAALAHVNRLPLLILPGDIFASRTPDPVLQHVEHFQDGTVSANDCFKPVSRYFDRINRPEQLINCLNIAMSTLLDPVNCGPVTIALPQDVQAEAFDFPVSLFEKKVHRIRKIGIDPFELNLVAELIKSAKKPLIIAGGGVHYALATDELSEFATKHGIPVAETQAGKGALPWQHKYAVGGIGVTGSEAANRLAKDADVVIAIGTRLQDFTTESRTLFNTPNKKLIQINVTTFDVIKHNAVPLLGDAKIALQQLTQALDNYSSSEPWFNFIQKEIEAWKVKYLEATKSTDALLPSDAQVLGAVKRKSDLSDVVVCAAGGLPGELHKLWRPEDSKSYHVEYGFSCMGYEIAAGLGVKMACPERDVFVVVGDGSYMMMNSELATSVMLGYKIIVIVLDNRGYGCINRLQNGTGNASFNNLLADCESIEAGAPKLDFAAHAKSMGADSEFVTSIQNLEQAIVRAKASTKSYVISLDTDPYITTDNGNSWWDVAIPEVSENDNVNSAQIAYKQNKKAQPY
jgi:3D-(3,5/4)-trihydroxycyclohexane-1,2-dione acylhydrolase (decyclizing)